MTRFTLVYVFSVLASVYAGDVVSAGKGGERETAETCGANVHGRIIEKHLGGQWVRSECRALTEVLSAAPSPIPELELENPANQDRVILAVSADMYPGTYSSWAELFDSNAGVDDFVLAAGGYRPWGPMIYSGAGGKAASRRVVRFEGSTHPVDSVGIQNEALIHGAEWSSSY